MSAQYDLIIAGGQVVLENEVRTADIGVRNGVITKIADKIDATAIQEVRAKGQIVSPANRTATHGRINDDRPASANRHRRPHRVYGVTPEGPAAVSSRSRPIPPGEMREDGPSG